MAILRIPKYKYLKSNTEQLKKIREEYEELGKYYNFNDGELSFTKNYNLKYRMGERERGV